MQKTKEQLGEEFWQRVETLMGEERPYSWCVRIGINKGSFQSAYNRRARPLDQTINKWSDKIGVSSEWLKTGIGEPYPKDAQQPQSRATPDLAADINTNINTDGIDMALMVESVTIVEDYLTQHNKHMDSGKKAELIVHIYDLLCKSPDAGQAITSVLKLAI